MRLSGQDQTHVMPPELAETTFAVSRSPKPVDLAVRRSTEVLRLTRVACPTPLIHAFWGYFGWGFRRSVRIVITLSIDATAIAAVMIVTGVLLLAYVVRGVPKAPTGGLAQGEVVLVATTSKKKSSGNA